MGGVGIRLGVTHGGGGWTRASFATQVATILGTAPVAGYLADGADVLTSTDPWNGGTWTADATMAGQLTAQGRGWLRAFTTNRYLTRPDALNQSFGDGLTDLPFTLFFYGSITDTAAVRGVIAKQTVGNIEYRLIVNASDILQLILTDVGQAVNAVRNSDAPITQGSKHLYWATYSGLGGALAANGIVMGVDNAVIASTAFNDPSYVAMKKGLTPAPLDIGATVGHTVQFLDGSDGMTGLVPGAASLATMTALTAICSQYFGAP